MKFSVKFGLLAFHGGSLERATDQIATAVRDEAVHLFADAEVLAEQPDRDRALVLLLLDTGIRLSEAAGMTVHDLDLIEGRCRVMGKGAKERVVPVGRKARRAVRLMLARRRRS